MSETPIAQLAMVSLDTDDPQALAEFYSKVTGYPIMYSGDGYAMIGTDGVTSIGFGKVEKYHPPQWPDEGSEKRFHLDFYVDDLEIGVAACRELGATLPEFQPGGERWRVVLDPAGHPFCLCLRSPESSPEA